MDPDQPAHPRSLIRIHAVRLQTLLQVEKLIAKSMDPDQTARMCRLVWIHAGHKRTLSDFSWRIWSYIFCVVLHFSQETLCYICLVWNHYLYVEVERNLTKSQPIFLPRTSNDSTNRVPSKTTTTNGKSAANGHVNVKHHKHTKSNDYLMFQPAVTEVGLYFVINDVINTDVSCDVFFRFRWTRNKLIYCNHLKMYKLVQWNLC
jgi:hypothetical protein